MFEFTYLILVVVFFIVGVYVTRWIFGIKRLIDGLETQNKLAIKQIRLLAKMLIIQGVEKEEIDNIIEHGNSGNNGHMSE